MGRHVLSRGHLITWGLDTSLISDLRHCAVERWYLGRDPAPGGPGKLAGGVLDLSLGQPRPGQALLHGKGGFPKVIFFCRAYSWSS
jgi:hypothetical protein